MYRQYNSVRNTPLKSHRRRGDRPSKGMLPHQTPYGFAGQGVKPAVLWGCIPQDSQDYHYLSPCLYK